MDYETFYQENVRDLKINAQRTQAYGICPFHQDNKASLSVSLSTGQYRCHACGSYGNQITFARHLGLCLPSPCSVPVPAYRESAAFCSSASKQEKNGADHAGQTHRKIVATYQYQYENGALAYEVVRYDPKGFAQRRKENGVWAWGTNGIRRVPYHLPKIIHSNELIFLVEGEKDVETIERLGLVGTTTAMGAKGWDTSYACFFKNKFVCAIPDNDDPGRAYAEQAAQDISAAGGRIKIVTLPALVKKGDVTDWIRDGHTKEELLSIVKNTPPWIKRSDISDEPAWIFLNRIGVLSAGDGCGFRPKEFKSLCKQTYESFVSVLPVPGPSQMDSIMPKIETLEKTWADCHTQSAYRRFQEILREIYALAASS